MGRVSKMTLKDIEKDPQSINDLGYFYLGYYDACRDHKQTMRKIMQGGWSLLFILRVRRWIKEEIKAR